MLSRVVSAARLGPVGSRFAHAAAVLPELPYSYDALEPAISSKIMELHHSKHHAAYVANYNAAVAKEAELLAAGDTKGLIANQAAIKFNGGGHINHSIFWQNLSPNGGTLADGKLKDALKNEFGSVDEFKKQFTAACMSIQGSGWGWLKFDSGRLGIETCPNQDPLLSGTPLLGFDMWEHAFYLDVQNQKNLYLDALWDVVNWDDVQARYAAAAASK